MDQPFGSSESAMFERSITNEDYGISPGVDEFKINSENQQTYREIQRNKDIQLISLMESFWQLI